MPQKSLLISGCGDLGQRVGSVLAERGWQIHAIRRNPDGSSPQFNWHCADHCNPDDLEFVASVQPNFVLATFNPTSRDIAGYWEGFSTAAKNLLQSLKGHRPQHLFMVSSTRVYAETKGEWVDESAALSELDERALAIIDAEHQFLHTGLPATVVRFAGIYGGSSTRLLSKVARGEISSAEPIRYTNRIHRTDCAGFLLHLLGMAVQNQSLAPVYNGVDDNPCPAHEVEQWLADMLGASANTHSGHPPAGTISHKRCRNDLLHACGYQLRHPDYRSGYSRVLARSQ